MLYRRAAGILAAVLLVPPLLGASEIACSRHGDHHRPAAVAATPVEGHEQHHQSSPQDTAPTERHPVSDCCPAMSTCSGIAIQVVESAFGLRSLHNEQPVDLVTLSNSRVESPDPPPPKA